MQQSLPLTAKLLFFIGQQAGLFNLLNLIPQQILTSCTVNDVIL